MIINSNRLSCHFKVNRALSSQRLMSDEDRPW